LKSELIQRAAVSLAANLDSHFSVARAVKFTEKDALPGAQRKRFVFYEYLFAAANDRAFAVCVGIAFNVAVTTSAMRDQL
jgi:hypothetical protein